MATKKKLVRVVYWMGPTQYESQVSDYKEAMKLVSDNHRNKFDPCYYEIATGKELWDDGHGLATEDYQYVV